MKSLSIKFYVACAATLTIMTALALVSQKTADITLPIEQTQQQVVYTLRDYKGKIAVYKGTSAEPIEVFEIFSNSLPEEEYIKVMAGVRANSESELQMLIEAYTS